MLDEKVKLCRSYPNHRSGCWKNAVWERCVICGGALGASKKRQSDCWPCHHSVQLVKSCWPKYP